MQTGKHGGGPRECEYLGGLPAFPNRHSSFSESQRGKVVTTTVESSIGVLEQPLMPLMDSNLPRSAILVQRRVARRCTLRAVLPDRLGLGTWWRWGRMLPRRGGSTGVDAPGRTVGLVRRLVTRARTALRQIMSRNLNAAVASVNGPPLLLYSLNQTQRLHTYESTEDSRLKSESAIADRQRPKYTSYEVLRSSTSYHDISQTTHVI